ncbi:MAG TPA: polyamine ABC transporter substrate-binding protein, partial [Oxalobacteraceae bacterium]|nr:polyamine ABC transporter substrate-binding protein [Oxalobacteraceae bacterium]
MNSPAFGAAIGAPVIAPSGAQLRRDLRKAQLRKQTIAIALVAPLAIFLLITFVIPIAILLERAVENPEVATALPHTVATLAGWDRKSTPPDAAYAALAADLAKAQVE